MILYWRFANESVSAAGAIPPADLDLDYGHRRSDSPYRHRDFATRWRAIESGYVVLPSDCPPIRMIARYGFCAFCPGTVVFDRRSSFTKERVFEDASAHFGWAVVGGDRWPQGDSGFIASWIAGSEYVKIQTGIEIAFAEHLLLYQGPLPNSCLLPDVPTGVMSGIESYSHRDSTTVAGERYGVAQLNVIVRLPQMDGPVVVKRRTPIVWFYAVERRQTLEPLIRVSVPK